MNNFKRWLCAFAVLLLLTSLPGVMSGEKLGSLRIRCFKIGKADAYLLLTDSQAVLIDAGEEDDAQEIIAYLGEHEIPALDCLILTHFDKRSIGGVPELLGAVKVTQVLMPDYDKAGNLAVLVQGMLETQKTQKVTQRTVLDYGSARFTVLPAQKAVYQEDEDNDYSLVVSVSHGRNSFFFAGDIMSERIAEMSQDGLLTPHTFIKMPCHGQNISGLDQLLDAVQPQIAVIPASRKNPPAGAVLANLEARGVRFYITMEGSVTLISDGYQVTVTQKPPAP